jgi:hypothetical protein
MRTYADRFLAFRYISSAVDELGSQSYSPGYSVTQFVWGAYIETASLVSFAIMNLARFHLTRMLTYADVC